MTNATNIIEHALSKHASMDWMFKSDELTRTIPSFEAEIIVPVAELNVIDEMAACPSCSSAVLVRTCANLFAGNHKHKI